MRKLVVVFVVLFCPFIGKAGESGAPKESLLRSAFGEAKEFFEKEIVGLWHKKRCALYVASLKKAIENNDTQAVLALVEKPFKLDQESKDLLRFFIRDYSGTISLEMRTILYDHNIAFHGQLFVVGTQMFNYLEQQVAQSYDELGSITRDEYERNRASRQEYLEYLKENVKGMCNGLSVLWMYGKRLEDDSFSTVGEEKDDNIFFNKVWRSLALWDGVSQFTVSQKNDIERFFSNMNFYQSTYHTIFGEDHEQNDLSNFLQDTKRGDSRQLFEAKIVGDRAIVAERLKQLVKPKTMIRVSGPSGGGLRHVIAIYQNSQNNAVYFYDSNDSGGEQKVESFVELADKIFAALDPQRNILKENKIPCQGWILPLEFNMYQFEGDPVYEYPTEQDLKMTVDKFKQFANSDCFLADQERALHAYRADPFSRGIPSDIYNQAFAEAVMRALNGDSLTQEKKEALVEKIILRSYRIYIKEELFKFIATNYRQVVDAFFQKPENQRYDRSAFMSSARIYE